MNAYYLSNLKSAFALYDGADVEPVTPVRETCCLIQGMTPLQRTFWRLVAKLLPEPQSPTFPEPVRIWTQEDIDEVAKD
ncbi:hypothetical protein VZG28_04940 [Synechococcus elongatus IITB4]|uniref:hypothetical protein n=1 Tax=Synechococcus elongatus TaxID=32046 RepID=UPI0030D0212E